MALSLSGFGGVAGGGCGILHVVSAQNSSSVALSREESRDPVASEDSPSTKQLEAGQSLLEKTEVKWWLVKDSESSDEEDEDDLEEVVTQGLVGKLFLTKTKDEEGFGDFVYKLEVKFSGETNTPKDVQFELDFESPLTEEKIKNILDNVNGSNEVSPDDIDEVVKTFNSYRKDLISLLGPKAFESLQDKTALLKTQ
ncbi:hypothetical protein MHLP_02005 [Candidatus Mycoplasma haematolamae str. Purdue]|uniref:Uncharacterized protein n=1 Tax=Mycoplasma haematolamae (strain Purdue) TaxID=1212765 RepID=I7CFJ7_MYCHA|nr:hypothetical protein [Candidatus Mycoplasma haematolamae]AFO51981.1 hypothetical protein MHLP_02005 [Candidatus Mycoplasma haematolamae str. Purdue]